jgi:hypothetical protein
MRLNRFALIRILAGCSGGIALVLLMGCDRNDLGRLGGYSRVSLMQKYTPEREASIARHAAELLRQGRYDDIIQMLPPPVVTGDTRQSLTAIHDLLAQGEPTSIKVIDVQKFRRGDAAVTNIVLDYEFPPSAKAADGGGAELSAARWVFLTFSIGKTGIIAINATASEVPIEAINAFTFENKGVSQYAALAVGVLLSAFTLYSVVVCIRAERGTRRLLWLLLMLFTVSPVSVNWTTGRWSLHEISYGFSVPPWPARLRCSAYGPWQLILGLPIGAVAFVLYLKFRKATISEATTVETHAS